MKKMIVTLVLLLVVVLSVVSCSCGTEEVTTTGDNTAVSTPDTNQNGSNREPIYDTDGGWGPLVPLQPIS